MLVHLAFLVYAAQGLDFHESGKMLHAHCESPLAPLPCCVSAGAPLYRHPLEWGELAGAMLGRMTEGIDDFIFGCISSFINTFGEIVLCRVQRAANTLAGVPTSETNPLRKNHPPPGLPIYLQLGFTIALSSVAYFLGRRAK